MKYKIYIWMATLLIVTCVAAAAEESSSALTVQNNVSPLVYTEGCIPSGIGGFEIGMVDGAKVQQIALIGAGTNARLSWSAYMQDGGFVIDLQLDAVVAPGTEEYTFERFVVGNSNKLAHAAALAVAEHPAENYNPLFIHGESGLGKTHLLYAIAHTIHKNHPDYKIVYIRGEDFTNELIRDIRAGKNQEFRAKYRSADVFLMDDVQFIAGRDSTQEEMFHTFNTLYEDKKQIVFTADRPPKEMLRLEDRLKTRFEWGLLADIQPPDYETRMAIIKNKAIRMGVELPEEVLIYVAENVTSNVRQIEGTVKKILAFRDLLGSNVDASSVTRAVRDMFKEPSDILPTAEVIIEEVGKFYDIDPNAIRGQGRTKATSWARHIAIYLTRHMTKLSLKDIGKEFDNRDHSTVLNSLTRIERLMKNDPEKAEIIKDITANINIRYE